MASKTKRIPVSRLQADMRDQIKQLSASTRRRWVRKVIGPAMVGIVLTRFLRGSGPNGQRWKSPSAETKYGGRWSLRYTKRPSGDTVSADKTRLVDTTGLANCYRPIEVTAETCKVGPKINAARNRPIAEREAEYGNQIVGWDDESKAACDSEMAAFAWAVAQGKEPPALPQSQIGRRTAV